MGRHNRRKRNQQQKGIESKNKMHNEFPNTLKVEDKKHSLTVRPAENLTKIKMPDLNSNIAVAKMDSKVDILTNSLPSSNRDYYLHYLCHICKTIPKDSEKVNCSKCKLITYCSIKHKREHWSSHADMCEALAEIFCTIDLKGVSPDFFRTIRVEVTNKCKALIERSLEKWEREVILYHNHCHACYERDGSLLESCQVCKHVSFCKNHPLRNDHARHCLSLVLYRNIVIRILTNNPVPIYFPETFSEEFKQKDMASFCNEEADGELEIAFLSEIATAPLTVLQALRTVFGTKLPQRLCVHFIGAENDFELNVIEKWETFLSHYLSCEELLLVFIGPELYCNKNAVYKMCELCEANKKKFSMNFYFNVLYHDYVLGSEFIKPNLICSFNPGFYRTTGFNNTDTWQETIFQILQQNVPILTTEYTKVEILKDVRRIEEQSKLTSFQEPSLNPFSSLKPFLNFVYDEGTPVIFKNYYFAIFQAQGTELN